MAPKNTTTANRTQSTTAKPAPAGNAPAVQDQQPQRQLTAAQEAVMQRRQRLARFGEFLVERQQTLLECLPDEINPQKFISVIKTALQAKPDLLNCTFESLWNACTKAALMGLMPDGKEGAIAPYGDMGGGAKAEIATFMPMVEGYRKLARNAGIIDWRAGLVYARDEFDFEEGDKPYLHHKRYFGADDPGPLVGAYSIATLPDGTISREVMTIRELNAIRSVSKAKNGPWSRTEFQGEMYKKTVVRRHFKVLPKSNNDLLLARAIEHDDHEFGPKFDAIDAAPVEPSRQIAASPAQRLADFAGDASGEQVDQETGEVPGEEDMGSAETTKPAAEPDKTVAKPSKSTADATSAKPDKDAAAASGDAGAASAPQDDATGGEAEAGENPSAADDPDGVGFGENAAASLGGGDAALEALDDASDFPGDRPAGVDPRAPGGSWEKRWDAGEEPATEEEYRHYLPYVLKLNCKTPGQVAPFWKSAEQQKLREVCGCASDPQFNELMTVAMDYRKKIDDRRGA